MVTGIACMGLRKYPAMANAEEVAWSKRLYRARFGKQQMRETKASMDALRNYFGDDFNSKGVVHLFVNFEKFSLSDQRFERSESDCIGQDEKADMQELIEEAIVTVVPREYLNGWLGLD